MYSTAYTSAFLKLEYLTDFFENYNKHSFFAKVWTSSLIKRIELYLPLFWWAVPLKFRGF